MSKEISPEQRDIANQVVARLVADGKAKVMVQEGLEALLDAFDAINRRIHPADSCSQESATGRTAH